MASLPIADRIRKERRLPQYYRVVEGLKQCSIVLYAEQFLQLGRGSFGKCYLGKIVRKAGESLENFAFDELVRNNEVIAVKVIAKGSHSITPECYRNEVSLLHKLTNGPDTNPNIIRLIIPKCIESEKNYYLVTEYCNNCTLYDLMETRRQERRRFTLWEFIQLALDLVSGYFALKNRGIMHNDLKPQNIFIKDKVFKIGDFGLALKLSSTHGAVPCGTILYAAPEKLNRHAHRTDVDHKADIYALGLILYEVLYGCHPYWEKQEFENFRRQTYDRMAKEGSLRKYSEKQLKKQVFFEYLEGKSAQRRNVQLSPVPGDKAQLTALTEKLEALVVQMCVLDRQRRKSLQQVVLRMRELSLEGYIHRNDLFPDLQELSQSELRFQLANMSKVAVEKVQTNSIRSSLQMQATQPITLERVRMMKQRLYVVFELFRLVRVLREQLDGQSEAGVGLQHYPPSHFPQLINNYLCATNCRELDLANQQMLIMSEEELRVANRENVSADLRQLKLNDEELFNEAQTDPDEEEDAHRAALLTFIEDRLTNELITYKNWSDILAWVLLYNAVMVEQAHRNNENKEEMERQLGRIEAKLALFKLESLSGEECRMGLEVLFENEKHFSYSYDIDLD